MVCKNKDFHKANKKTLKKKHLKKGGSLLGGILKTAAHSVTAPIELLAPDFIADKIKHGECELGQMDNSTIAMMGLGAAGCIVTAGAGCVAEAGAAGIAEGAAVETAELAGKEVVESGLKKELKKEVKGKISNKLKDHSHADIKKAKKQIDECNKNGNDKHMSRISDSLGAWMEPDADPVKIQANLEYHQKKLAEHTAKRKKHLEKVELERVKEAMDKLKPPDNPDYLLFLIMYLLNQYKLHSLEYDLNLREEQQKEYKKALEEAKQKNIDNIKTLRKNRDAEKTAERKVRANNRDKKEQQKKVENAMRPKTKKK